MIEIFEPFVEFFADNFPTPTSLLLGGPPAFAWAYFALWAAGSAKAKWKLKTGYSRKLFHFCIFATAAVVQTAIGTPALCLFGAMTTLVILVAVWRGDGHPMYEAIAREKDAPRRTYYILVPYFATFLGGVTSNVWFGSAALVGYLVTGVGDALAEPVGTKWGKHQYRAPTLTGVRATRSLEGSSAVFIVSIGAFVVATALLDSDGFSALMVVRSVLLAAICTIVEAVSPHGWDNFTLQLIPAWMFAATM